MKKFNCLYLDIILGGFFGTIRGLILVFFFLFIFKCISMNNYNYYVKNSIFFSIFFQFVNYFFNFFGLS
ncbi:CvpA family protein [Buchnera aphidicola]|uniref:Colicin V production protein n=1 Tax=Buchnera aphidicola (Lipaphis pseudobrassicae) TaxID=1258543 RepID=A0A4D6XXU9_9GAMM|nr:CvpA family protein [Buchnera aphidicola]QCI22432.1 hypothetical protein D9V70_00860 [Buchnera aphidicola (Lipaphis pseudobrassicae)]